MTIRLASARESLREILAALRTWPWFETVRTLRERIREDRLGLTASSLTFTTLISLVPLLTVMLAVFTAFPMFGNFQVGLEKYFLQSLVPATIAKPVLGALTSFAAKASRLGAAGLVALVFTAMALVLTIDRTLNAIWRVRKPRPIGQRVLIYWAALTLGPLVVGASMTFTSYAISASSGLVRQLPGGVSFALGLTEFLALALASAALYHYVPHAPVRWRHALAGGLFVSAGVEIAKKGLGWYLSAMPSYSSVYGAFATVPIFLLWIYLCWLIVLLGAVIAAYAPSLQMRVVRRPPTPGHRFALAVAVLRELVAARRSQRHGMSITELAQRLRTEPLQIEPILDRLVEMDWAARLDEAGAQRHVLLCEPAATGVGVWAGAGGGAVAGGPRPGGLGAPAPTPVRPLVAALLLDPTAEVGGFWQRAGLETMMLAEVLEGA